MAPPVVVLLVGAATPLGYLDQLLGFVLGVPLILWSLRRPGGAILVLAVLLPFQIYFVAALYHLGLPIPVVRGVGWLKEALVVGVVFAGIHAVRTTRRRFDRLDRIALLWIVGVIVYAVFAQVLSAKGAPTSIDIRIQGIRANAFFAVLFLGARHAPLPPHFATSLRRTLIVVPAIIAVIGLYQYLDPQGWIDFTFDTIEVPRHQQEVLHITPQQIHQNFGWLSLDPVRVGSVFISPFEYADFLLLGLALTCDRLLRDRAHPLVAVATLALALGVVVSHTRIDFLGAVLIVAVVLGPARGRRAGARVSTGLIVALGLAVLVPFLIGTRFTGADGGEASSRDHIAEFTTGVEHLLQDPIGRGLGTAPGVGSRFELEQTFISDNSILQVGNELGIVMMMVFVALLVGVLLALFSADREDEYGGLAVAVGAAGLGLVMVGMLHHVWLSIPVAWLFFGTAGVALSVGASRHDIGAPSRSPVARFGHR